MKRHLALGVCAATAATMSLSACGGSESKGASSVTASAPSTSASSLASSAGGSSPSSEVGEPTAPSSASASSAPADTLPQAMADGLKIKRQSSWTAPGALEATTPKSALVSDGQGMSGYRLSDGSKVWSNTFAAAPADAKITDPVKEKVTPLGSNVLAVWSGKSSDSGKDTSVVALYDIDTGKQVGKTQTFEQQWDMTRLQSSDVHASTMTYLLPWEDMLYSDATVRHVEMPKNADDLLGGQTTNLVTVTKDRALLTGASRSTGKTLIALTSGPTRIGSPLVCDMDQPVGRSEGDDHDKTDFVSSPNGQWAVWGKALVNLKTGENRCLSGLSSATVKPARVTDAGDVWGMANHKAFVLKHGATQLSVVPAVPDGFTPAGIIAEASDHISMFAKE